MKTLIESLLDDEDILLDKTDFMKNFPKRGKVNHSDGWDGGRIWYYTWKDSEVLPSHIYGDSILYITWVKYEDSYIICLMGSNKNFFNSHPIISNTNILINTDNEKIARKQAYELLVNIAANFNILNYMKQQKGNGYTIGLKNAIDIEKIKKEFKDSWQEIK